jgi:hypothetical protein
MVYENLYSRRLRTIRYSRRTFLLISKSDLLVSYSAAKLSLSFVSDGSSKSQNARAQLWLMTTVKFVSLCLCVCVCASSQMRPNYCCCRRRQVSSSIPELSLQGSAVAAAGDIPKRQHCGECVCTFCNLKLRRCDCQRHALADVF